MIRQNVQGSALLEALIAIFIFSIGVLALLGMQANAINYISDSKYRTDAAYLANQLFSQMWADLPSNYPSYAYSGSGSPNPILTDWNQQLHNTLGVVASNPIITVTPTTLSFGTQYTVTVTIRYRPPKSTTTHQFVSTAVLG